MANSSSSGAVKAAIHWQRTAGEAPACDLLSEHLEADFIVVGGGLTGARTALGLAEQGAKVIVLEANSIGYGASGRSGGQCNPIWRATPDELRKKMGAATADRLIQTTLTAADDLFADIARYGIDCDAEQTGWVQAAHCKPALRSLQRLGEAWNAEGAKIAFLDRAATQKTSGSGAYAFALFHPAGGHVQPLSLTRGFARTALRFGAQLYEQSPVTGMVRAGNRWKLSTPDGSVTAPQIILTTNAYSQAPVPELKQTFLPMVSIALATAPLSGNLQKSVLPNAVTISDTRRAIYFARYDRDRRLIFGCVGSTNDPAAFGGLGRLRRGLTTVFPQLSDTELEVTWAGRIAVTSDMMPHLHQPEQGVLAGLGFSGRGIAMTSVMARTLVKKALGADDSSLPFTVSPMRPFPLRIFATQLLPLAAPAMSIRDQFDTLIDPLRGS